MFYNDNSERTLQMGTGTRESLSYFPATTHFGIFRAISSAEQQRQETLVLEDKLSLKRMTTTPNTLADAQMAFGLVFLADPAEPELS